MLAWVALTQAAMTVSALSLPKRGIPQASFDRLRTGVVLADGRASTSSAQRHIGTAEAA
jgi:hypothetical protein